MRDEPSPFVVAAETTRMPMVFTDASADDNPIIFANDSLLRLTGFPRDELLGQPISFLLTPGHDSAEQFAERFVDQTRDDLESSFRRRDGSDFWASVLVSPVVDRNGNTLQYFASLIDLTKHKRNEETLRFGEQRFRMAATAAGLGVVDIDLSRGEKHWSPEIRAMLGIAADAPVSIQSYLALIHPDDRETVQRRYDQALRGETDDASEAVFRIVRAIDGEVRWAASRSQAMRNDAGDVARVIVTHRDITTEKTAKDQISWAATHDSVTMLPNRPWFRARLDAALELAAREAACVSLLLIDLDRFKQLNDLLGHPAGDEALAAFARRVAPALPLAATLARLGGDEFIAILPRFDAAAAAAVAARVLAAVAAPFTIAQPSVDLGASIGVSTFPADGRAPSELMRSADLALYAAKDEGGGRTRMFEPALRARRQREVAMLRHAHSALAHGWITPFYQPQIALGSGRIWAFEALLRWHHPRAGLQYPATLAFAFDDAHTSGLIGEAMAEAVFADMRRWRNGGRRIGKVAINASAAELRDRSYASKLLDRLVRHHLPASMLELEITETAFLDDRAAGTIAALTALRAAGVTVALDDFGTGYSSLSHLRDLPVDTIKIDRSFVAGLETSSRDRSITQAVLTLGTALGMATVAEGVETQEQADFLKAHGCGFAQGFLFSPAVSAQDAEAALAGEPSAAEPIAAGDA